MSRVDIIQRLPPDISSNILRMLDEKSLAAAADVSKSWLTVCRGDSVLRRRLSRQLYREGRGALQMKTKPFFSKSTTAYVHVNNKQYIFKVLPKRQSTPNEFGNQGGVPQLAATASGVGNARTLPSFKAPVESHTDATINQDPMSCVDIIGCLPPEIASYILRMLDDKSLAAAGDVSERWLAVCNADSVLRRRRRRQLYREDRGELQGNPESLEAKQRSDYILSLLNKKFLEKGETIRNYTIIQKADS